MIDDPSACACTQGLHQPPCPKEGFVQRDASPADKLAASAPLSTAANSSRCQPIRACTMRSLGGGEGDLQKEQAEIVLKIERSGASCTVHRGHL